MLRGRAEEAVIAKNLDLIHNGKIGVPVILLASALVYPGPCSASSEFPTSREAARAFWGGYRNQRSGPLSATGCRRPGGGRGEQEQLMHWID